MRHPSLWPTTRRGWLSVTLSLAALAMTLSLLSVSPAEAAQRARAAGTVAPDFSARTLDGRVLQLSAYRGRPVLLNFFSTDCPVSAAVVSNINQLQAERPDVVVLSVNLNHASAASLQRWSADNDAHYPLLLDPERAVARLYRPYATPFWVFIRPDGVIAAVRLGEHTGHNLAYRVNEYLPLAAVGVALRER